MLRQPGSHALVGTVTTANYALFGPNTWTPRPQMGEIHLARDCHSTCTQRHVENKRANKNTEDLRHETQLENAVTKHGARFAAQGGRLIN